MKIMDVKTDLIKQVFHSMEYGKNVNNKEGAYEWYKNKGNVFFSYKDKPDEKPTGEAIEVRDATDSDNILCHVYESVINIEEATKINFKWADVKPIDRFQILNKFAKEIEQNIDTIAQIEIVTRGLRAKDSKRQVKRLIEYLQYYSSFALKTNKENPTWKPNDVVQVKISEKIGLSILGSILGPSLAAGCNVVIFGQTLIAPITTFLLELAYKVGIPDTVLKFYPKNAELEHISYFEVTGGVKILVNSFKIPMIVFDNADLDSACDAVVDAAWGHHGSLPESVGVLLVQENILEQFLKKLKIHVKSLKVGLPDDQNADISSPTWKKTIDDLRKEVKAANNQGIEIYQPDQSSKKFQPTLFIGAKVHTNAVIENRANDSPYGTLTILSFRTIDEAVALANNTKQGYAASVWTENISLANEVSEKLNVSNVWINGHGLFTVDVSIVPRKGSGYGYIGGEEGFNLYWDNDTVNREIMQNPATQAAWHKTTKLNKLNFLHRIVDNFFVNKKKWSQFPESWLDNLPSVIYESITDQHILTGNTSDPGFIINTYREPVGTLSVELDDKPENHNLKLILHAILQGNSVQIVTQKYSEFYGDLFKCLPNGIVTISAKSNPNNFLFNKTTTQTSDIIRKVTCVKNVWSNVGQSSQCKL